MKHNLKLAVKNQAIAVERLLRVARHRGFYLTNMSLETQSDRFLVNVTVDSDKPIYLLTSQLNKLVEVNQVELEDYKQQAI